MLYKASAPGSLMLLGEYAILHQQPALVCAIDQRISVTLTPRNDQLVELISSLGHYQANLSELNVVAPFEFVLTSIKLQQTKITQGFTLQIESDFSHQIGFGSSAAVSVATVSVLAQWLKLNFSTMDLITVARQVVQTVQGIGSGADVAASVLGGVVAYRMQPLAAESLVTAFPITVVYSGSKTKTATALNYVNNRFSSYSKLFDYIMQAIGQCVAEAILAIKANDLVKLGQLMNIQQGLMSALGVNTESLAEIVRLLLAEKAIMGAKISGSGLGDCALGLGKVSTEFSLPTISVNIATAGVISE